METTFRQESEAERLDRFRKGPLAGCVPPRVASKPREYSVVGHIALLRRLQPLLGAQPLRLCSWRSGQTG